LADALVVGAGLTGLIAAKTIAEKGFSVIIYEEHKSVGVPNHCAGLISAEGFSRLNIELNSSVIQNRVMGGRIYSPNGTCIEIKDKKIRAYAIDREKLDLSLMNKAVDAGAKLVTGSKVTSLILKGRSVTGINGTNFNSTGLITIDAEGASRRLLKSSGWYTKESRPLIGVNVEADVKVEDGIVEIWLGEKLAKGFFSWVIPLEKGKARIGLATQGNDAIERLVSFIKIRFGSPKFSNLRAGLVLTDGPLDRTSYPGLLLVGDAAGHVKPTTGGGVVLGGMCAMEAGLTALEAIKTGDNSGKFLKRYDNNWKKRFRGEFNSMLLLRRFINSVNDDSIDRAFEAVKEDELDSALTSLVKAGDMDLQREVIRRALGNTKLFAVLLRVAGRAALSELGSFVNI